MGEVKRVIFEHKLSCPAMFNTRLVVELCENVHVHYRNLRLEFSREEFLGILEALKTVTPANIEAFEFGPDRHAMLCEAVLPERTEFDDRLILEEQVSGAWHLHYRNLRVEHTP